MTDTDESLLQAFASTRDEKAFRALADRYLGLVFHTAMSHTGHRQIAEEQRREGVTVIGPAHFLGFLDARNRAIPTAKRPKAPRATPLDRVAS